MALSDFQRGYTGSELVLAEDGGFQGWRAWNVDEPHVALHGHQSYEWTPGVNVATCNAEHGRTIEALAGYLSSAGIDVPAHRVEPTCECGFYAHNSPELLRSRARLGYPIGGIVRMWGRVLVGEHGYRAEKARIVALFSLGHQSTDPVAIADHYGVSFFASLDEAIKYHGEGR